MRTTTDCALKACHSPAQRRWHQKKLTDSLMSPCSTAHTQTHTNTRCFYGSLHMLLPLCSKHTVQMLNSAWIFIIQLELIYDVSTPCSITECVLPCSLCLTASLWGSWPVRQQWFIPGTSSFVVYLRQMRVAPYCFWKVIKKLLHLPRNQLHVK